MQQLSLTSLPQDAARAASTKRTRQLVKFAPDNFWSRSIRDAPLAANSAAVAANLYRQVQSRYAGHAAFNAYQYNTTFYQVPARQRRVDVAYWNCQNGSYVPPNFFSGPAYFKGVPIPDNAVPAVGTDGAISIYDPAADRIWEFWRLRRNTAAKQWEACYGGRLDNVSKSQGIYTYPYGVSASGLVMAGGVITIEEVKRGRIDHAMYLGVTESAHWQTVSWPANRSDGDSQDPSAPRHGQRIRLDPSIDVAKLGLSPIGQMIARAAQEYGFIVCDRSGVVAVVTESGQPAKARTRVNPWDRLLKGTPTYLVLKNFPWHRLQVLPPDYGKP